MKKIMLVAALMLSSVATFAQHAVGSFNIQPKVGLNIANLTDYSKSDARLGLVQVLKESIKQLTSFQLALVCSTPCKVLR